jgi:rfaE bifunctional protein nucleotidyltransferase chain/domain
MSIISSNELKPEVFLNQKTVVVGGCFDVLHKGHVIFLEEAKKLGDQLVVLLESDERVALSKGSGRPIHIQSDRAIVLNALRSVDVVVCLSGIPDGAAYDELIQSIHPSIVATTEGDPHLEYKVRSAELVNAKVVCIPKVEEYSTTRLIEQIKQTQ